MSFSALILFAVSLPFGGMMCLLCRSLVPSHNSWMMFLFTAQNSNPKSADVHIYVPKNKWLCTVKKWLDMQPALVEGKHHHLQLHGCDIVWNGRNHRIPKREQKTEVLLLGVKGLHTKIKSGREKSPPQSLLSSPGWANKIDTDRWAGKKQNKTDFNLMRKVS